MIRSWLRRPWRDGALAAAVAIALFAIYVACSRGQIKSYDGTIMVNLATRLLTKHTFTIDPAVDTLRLQHPYTSYGFGTSLFAIPFVALQRAVNDHSQALVSLASPMLLAASGSLLVLIGCRLGWRRSTSVLTALGFGLLTPALWQSTEMLSETGVALGSLLIVLGALRWRDAPRTSPLLVGVGAATVVLYRPDSVLLVLPLALIVLPLVPRELVFTRAALFGVGGPLGVVVAFQGWYDHRRYGSVFSTGMSQQARGQGFDTPLLRGLDFLLRSPSRGFFWSSLILLLAFPGVVLLYRRNRPLAIAIGALAIIRLLFYARWFTPGGGVAWGPRLLFPITPLLAIAAGETLEAIPRIASGGARRIAWAGVAVIALGSAFVSFLSVAIGYDVYWNSWTRAATRSEVRQRINDYYFSLHHNVIVGNFHLLRSGHVLAPMHFHNGADALGVLALVIGGSAAAIALIGAYATDRPQDATSPPDLVVEDVVAGVRRDRAPAS
jgi:hypothetical protein